MELTESDFTLKLQRAELLALQKGLKELATLQRKYPDERNGYDLNSKMTVDKIHRAINAALGEA